MSNLENNIIQGNTIDTLVNGIIGMIYTHRLKDLGFNTENFVKTIQNVSNAILSNTESGWSRKQNRRESLWGKLVQRHFSDEWNIKKYGTHFTLTKKD